MVTRDLLASGAAATLAVLLLGACAASRPVVRLEGARTTVALDLVYLDETHVGPIVDVRVGGRRGRFVVDTGFAGIGLSPRFAELVGAGDRGAVTVPTHRGEREVGVVGIAPVEFGHVTIDAGTALVLDDLQQAQDAYRIQLDGLLGVRLFRDHAVVLDYALGTLTICRPSELARWKNIEYRPFVLRQGQPHIALDLGNGADAWYFVDTGFTGSIRVEKGHPLRAPVVPPAAERDEPGWYGRIRTAGFGGVLFEDAEVEFTSADVDSPLTDAMLGSGLFRGRVLVFDNPGRRVGVSRGRSRMTGWGFGVASRGNRLVVDGVASWGPAGAAGLREGDIVHRVAGRNVTSATNLFRWLEPLERVRLDVERDGSRLGIDVERAAYLVPVEFREAAAR